MIWIVCGFVALIIGVSAYYWVVRRSKRRTIIKPLSLIQQPAVQAEVNQQDDGSYHVSWKMGSPLKEVTFSEIAENSGTKIKSKEQGEHYIIIDGLPQSKPIYFHLTFENGTMLTTSERILTFDGIANFRDIGGYYTHDGQYVRWGRIFRSGDTGSASDADLRRLSQMGVQFICDLRSDLEVADKPDRNPDSANNIVHLPVQANINRADRFRLLVMTRPQLEELVVDLYTQIILEQNAPVMGDILRQLADPNNLPALIHCTAGKDRTGILIGLLLSVLGVPDDVIIADYTLSNYYYQNFYDFAAHSTKQMAAIGFTPDDVQPLILARPHNMQQTLAYIQKQYGSVESYLKEKAGIDDKILEQLKTNLLE